MNYHHDEWIIKQVKRHYQEALKLYDERRIVGVFLQGSQNYGLDTEYSDVDTKLIVIPSWDDIIFNRKPISTTHILDNDEHLDAKDIRLMFQTFRKQNVNFLEILFTPYKKLSPYYTDLWNQLTTPENREMIAHYNPVQAVRTMCGMCSEKLHALEHLYPSKVDVIERYGYDPKQLHHIIRMTEYIKRYIAGEPYEACLRSRQPVHLRDIKLKPLPLVEARALATTQYQLAKQMYEQYRDSQSECVNPDVDVLLNQTQADIVQRYLMGEWHMDNEQMCDHSHCEHCCRVQPRKTDLYAPFSYRGLQGSADYDAEDEVWHGHILNIPDLVTYEAPAAEYLESSFQDAVDDYLMLLDHLHWRSDNQ